MPCRNRRKNIDLASKVDVEEESSAKLSPETRTKRPLSYETFRVSFTAWRNQKQEKTQSSIALEGLRDPKLHRLKRTRRTKALLNLSQGKKQKKTSIALKGLREKHHRGEGASSSNTSLLSIMIVIILHFEKKKQKRNIHVINRCNNQSPELPPQWFMSQILPSYSIYKNVISY
jgi:hypothetical protein